MGIKHAGLGRWPAFAEMLVGRGSVLTRDATATLQVNVGRLCNLACRHCHLEAGPGRTEVMTKETATEVIVLAERLPFSCIDVTGGAPEMNPHILDLLQGLAGHSPRMLLRSNLVAMADSARGELMEHCRRHRVAIVASFPAVNEAQAESQRGNGVFQRSLAGIVSLGMIASFAMLGLLPITAKKKHRLVPDQGVRRIEVWQSIDFSARLR